MTTYGGRGGGGGEGVEGALGLGRGLIPSMATSPPPIPKKSIIGLTTFWCPSGPAVSA